MDIICTMENSGGGFRWLSHQRDRRHDSECCCTFTFLQSDSFTSSHHHVSQGMLRKFFVQHILEDVLARMVQFFSHLGTLM
jgi:hypothetical protein